VSPPIPAIAAACPAQSNGVLCRGEPAARASRTRAAAPAGTFTKKISRHDTRAGREGARPHAAEASTNTTSPAPNARRAPSRSDSDPADNSSAANISV
jgi:hypothetical protein